MSGRPPSTMNGWKSAVFLLSFIFPLFHGTARATTVPPDLMPGDTYQLVFLTHDTIPALSPLLSTYDSFAQTEAILGSSLTGASLSNVYHAMVATADHPNMLVNAGVGISNKVYLLNGTSIVDIGSQDFWDGNHRRGITIDQNGVDEGFGIAWTGCDDYHGVSCSSNFRLGNAVLGSGEAGGTIYTDFRWVAAYDLTSLANSLPIYAISPIETVPGASTPLPAALVLYATGLGLMGLLGIRKRRHRSSAVAA